MQTTGQPPSYDTNDLPKMEIPPLPPSVTLQRVYTDLIRYLFQNTRVFFEDSTPNGAIIWERLKSRIIVVLCIPNGWDVYQKDFLRRSAVNAGIVEELNARSLIEFITEGEASVHYALKFTQSDVWLKEGSMFAVTDAGGSTIDRILYECKEVKPRTVLEEVTGSECVQVRGTSTGF